MDKTTWRLIINAPTEGAWNMAVDEAILESTAKHQQPTTLRLYSWNPYCLSLGYAQSISDINENALAQNGWDVVRRPTGGRAILHADELTYCICGAKDAPHLRGSVLESYRHLSKGLMKGLQLIGLPVTSEPNKSPSERITDDPICFEVPSDYEIKMGGKKIIGSAQARKNEGVLQHGAIPLFGDITRITKVLQFDSEEARGQAQTEMAARATTVAEHLSHRITWKEAAQAIMCGFAQELNIELVASRLSDQERKRAKILLDEKYSHDDWTLRL